MRISFNIKFNKQIDAVGRHFLRPDHKPGIEDVSIKSGIEDVSIKPVIEDVSIKLVIEDVSIKPGIEDVSIKLVIEDVSIKPRIDDVSINFLEFTKGTQIPAPSGKVLDPSTLMSRGPRGHFQRGQ